MTNRKLHNALSIDTKNDGQTFLDDLELYKFEFSENFAEFRKCRTQQQLNDWR